MMTAQTFWDRMAERYAARPVGNVTAWEDTLARTRRYLGPEADVLEIGCGTGSSALKLAGDAGRYTGTDISPEMIRIARGKSEGLDNLTFEVADLTGLTGSYDAVVAYNLLQLIDDIPGAMRQVYDVTKPGGVFVSKSACIGGLWVLKPVIWLARILGKAPYVNFLRVATLEDALRQAGFVIEESEAIPRKGRNQFIVARRPRA